MEALTKQNLTSKIKDTLDLLYIAPCENEEIKGDKYISNELARGEFIIGGAEYIAKTLSAAARYLAEYALAHYGDLPVIRRRGEKLMAKLEA